jgi:hypothetical protein
LDFPPIPQENGTFQQFKNGLETYGKGVMDWLDSAAGGVNIDPWVDVDASDLGRLGRHPNTIHHGAAYDDETRWCVPVTIEELSELTVDRYLAITQEPRWSNDYCRNPSKRAGNKAVQAIRAASESNSESNGTASAHNTKSVKEYSENKNITLEDISFMTANKPCIEAFRNRDDAFNHGNGSHLMELSIIGRFVQMNVPKDVIHEFFADIPGYDKRMTEEQINKIIGRKYKEFNCENIIAKAPTFCLGSDCSVYNRSDDLQK